MRDKEESHLSSPKLTPPAAWAERWWRVIAAPACKARDDDRRESLQTCVVGRSWEEILTNSNSSSHCSDTQCVLRAPVVFSLHRLPLHRLPLLGSKNADARPSDRVRWSSCASHRAPHGCDRCHDCRGCWGMLCVWILRSSSSSASGPSSLSRASAGATHLHDPACMHLAEKSPIELTTV
jgi:hypothetical protein